jgi:Lon protease-like protein
MIGLCSDEDRPFGVILIREGMEVGEPAKPFEIGTMARIIGIDRLADGRMNIVTVGTQRFRVVNYSVEKKPYIVGDVEVLEDDAAAAAPADDIAGQVAAMAQRYVALVQAAAEQELTPLELPSNAEELSFLVGATLRIRNRERQRLLEINSTAERLQLEKEILERETATLEEFIQRRVGGLGPFSRN